MQVDEAGLQGQPVAVSQRIIRYRRKAIQSAGGVLQRLLPAAVHPRVGAFRYMRMLGWSKGMTTNTCGVVVDPFNPRMTISVADASGPRSAVQGGADEIGPIVGTEPERITCMAMTPYGRIPACRPRPPGAELGRSPRQAPGAGLPRRYRLERPAAPGRTPTFSCPGRTDRGPREAERPSTGLKMGPEASPGTTPYPRTPCAGWLWSTGKASIIPFGCRMMVPPLRWICGEMSLRYRSRDAFPGETEISLRFEGVHSLDRGPFLGTDRCGAPGRRSHSRKRSIVRSPSRGSPSFGPTSAMGPLQGLRRDQVGLRDHSWVHLPERPVTGLEGGHWSSDHQSPSRGITPVVHPRRPLLHHEASPCRTPRTVPPRPGRRTRGVRGRPTPVDHQDRSPGYLSLDPTSRADCP